MDKIIADDGLVNIVDDNIVSNVNLSTDDISTIQDIPINPETGEPYFKIQEDWVYGVECWKIV